MILRFITTRNFRNLEPGEHAFHPAANILVGRNGQGKTNLLEAIYFLATTKSFRTARVASLVRFGATNVYAAGALRREGVERQLSVGIETGETKRRVLMINEEKVALPAYLGAMSVFAYSAARLEILRGAPEERRRFLDRGIAGVNAGYLDHLTRYLRVLKQRNALLHAIGSHREPASNLDAWEEEFATSAQAVQQARATYAEALAQAFARIVEEHRYHVAGVQLAYRPSVVRFDRRAEIRARMSLAGPQRDVLDFVLDGRPAAEVLSGGEQKMIVLFLKFAKLELFRRRHDDSALFLLDDVDAELDLEILQKLLLKLPAETQVFATSAKESFLEALRTGPHRRLVIDSGQVTATRDFA